MKSRLTLISVAIAAVLGSAGQDAGARTALEAARKSEVVDGNLDRAIRQYQSIADKYKNDRAVVADALLHLADCYRKLGDAQATRIYRRILAEYADQKDAASAARSRLDHGAAASTDDRVVARGPDITWGDGRISVSGRFICYTDWNWTGNLMLRDVSTGTDRALTGNKDWTVGNSSTCAFSPDGRQIAYGWRTYGNPVVNDLRILALDGGTDPQPRRVAVNDQVDYYNPTDWSSDGRFLAGTISRKDRTTQIVIIDVRDGAARVMKTLEWGGPGQVFFSPDGKYIAYDLQQADDIPQRDVFVMSVDAETETRVVSSAADDEVMGWSPDGSRLLFASDRTGDVGLWGMPIQRGRASGPSALIRPNIGSVLSLGLSASGTLHIVRDASTVALQMAPIDLSTGKLTGPPVLESFRAGRPAWSFDGKQVAYKVTGANRLDQLAIRASEGDQPVGRLPASLRYISEPQWLADDRAIITAGRDARGRTGLFRIDATTGQVVRIADYPRPAGRVQVSPDGRHIYYDAFPPATSGGPTARVERDLVTGEVRTLYERKPTSGSPELSPDGKWLAFVEGERQKSSALFVYPVAGGEARELFWVNQPDALAAYGAITWTPDSQRVIVVNTTFDSRTGRATPKELWLVSLNGDTPRKLDIDVSDWASEAVRLSRDGRRLAFFTGRDAREVWALEGVTTARAADRARR
jgi:Tol biopolymer transport system component